MKEVDFSLVVFWKKTNFFQSIFLEEVIFFRANFIKETDFYRTRFMKKSSFLGTIFREKVDFSKALFMDDMSFSKSNIENIIIYPVTKKSKKVKINFNQSVIKNLFFNETILEIISDETSRNTLVILKDAAINKHDKVLTLGLHKKEYERHYKDVTKEKKWSWDWVILSFEKTVSEFGTNPGKAVLWWVSVMLFLGGFIFFIGIWDQKEISYFGKDWLSINFSPIWWGSLTWLLIIVLYFSKFVRKVFMLVWITIIFSAIWFIITLSFMGNEMINNLISYSLNPLALITDNKEIFVGSKFWLIMHILTFAKTILLSVIAFEIIKSFRKFSNK